MKILKAIGGFFVKIWRWIKNTAWVQPLLIVGAIFGIIFSIPAITSGIQGLINSKNSADNFYGAYKKSLEGGINSPAEVLIDNYDKYAKYEKKEEIPESEYKYFIMFTATGNATAKDIKGGFETLRDNWNSLYIPNDGKNFHLYTIYTDETTSSTTKTTSAFSKFLDRKGDFLEKAAEVGHNSNYYIKKKITDDDLNKLIEATADTFKTPTIILVDWAKNGISEVMFDAPGSDNYVRAKLLSDCWNHEGDFSAK